MSSRYEDDRRTSLDTESHEDLQNWRCDANSIFYKTIKSLTESKPFNIFIMSTIVVNALFLALDTNEDIQSKHQDLLQAFDYFFLSIYTVEFMLKIYAEPLLYWPNLYNVFDFGVLLISYFQIIFELVSYAGHGPDLQGLKVLRALRTLRTLRTVHFIKGMQVLVIALIDVTRRWVLNILMLLLLIMFIFAVLGFFFFGDPKTGDPEHWGSFQKALQTLFSYATVDGWTDLQSVLDDKNLKGSRVFTISFIFLGHFIFTNMFIGVIIMNISEATEKFKKEEVRKQYGRLQYKKELMMQRQRNEIKQMFDRQRKGQYTNFKDMVKGFQKTLRHDETVIVSELCTNLLWLEAYLLSLDHLDTSLHRVQKLHFEMAGSLAEIMEERLEKAMQAKKPSERKTRQMAKEKARRDTRKASRAFSRSRSPTKGHRTLKEAFSSFV